MLWDHSGMWPFVARISMSIDVSQKKVSLRECFGVIPRILYATFQFQKGPVKQFFTLTL